MIPVYEPLIGNGAAENLAKAIKDNWISRGKFVEQCQERLISDLGVKHVSLVCNGTAACHVLALILREFHPKVTRVMVPDVAYVAAWNAFRMNPIYDLIPVKTDPQTLNMTLSDDDCKEIDKREDTAVLVVHNIGNIIDVPKLQARIPNTIILEDNCEGFLGKHGQDYSGTTSCASAVSFFANKTITCGEGGAVMTNHKDIHDFVESVINQGVGDKRYHSARLGYNYRMNDLQGAVLYSQLNCLQDILAKKNAVASSYTRSLPQGVARPKVEQGCRISPWMQTIILDEDATNMSIFLRGAGVETRRMFPHITAHEHLGVEKKIVPHSSSIAVNNSLMLPSSPGLTGSEITKICSAIRQYLEFRNDS